MHSRDMGPGTLPLFTCLHPHSDWKGVMQVTPRLSGARPVLAPAPCSGLVWTAGGHGTQIHGTGIGKSAPREPGSLRAPPPRCGATAAPGYDPPLSPWSCPSSLGSLSYVHAAT